MQTNRISLLALGPQNVCPPVDGGKESIYGALKILAKTCDITYAFPSIDSCVSLDDYATINVDALPVPWLPKENIFEILSATIKLQPYKFYKYSNSSAVKTYIKALGKTQFDAIICFHSHTANLGQGIREALKLDIPILVREHNIEYALVTSYLKSCHWAKKIAGYPFALLTRLEEQKIWREVDAVAFLSDYDFDFARNTGNTGNLILAREGIAIPPRRLDIRPPDSDAPLLVLLNPRATQSMLNLKDFLHKYWVSASQDRRLGTTELHVTGVNTEQLAKLTNFDISSLEKMRVRGLGFIDNISITLESSLALVSPTFVGGGIRKKVLEAMANQLPVIATSLDVETCTYFEASKNILEMCDIDSLCACVHRLKTDQQFWLSISDSARSTIDKHASWEQFGQTLIEEIHKLSLQPKQTQT